MDVEVLLYSAHYYYYYYYAYVFYNKEADSMSKSPSIHRVSFDPCMSYP